MSQTAEHYETMFHAVETDTEWLLVYGTLCLVGLTGAAVVVAASVGLVANRIRQINNQRQES